MPQHKPIPRLDYHAFWNIDEETGIVTHKGNIPNGHNHLCKPGMPVGRWTEATHHKGYFTNRARVGKHGFFLLARVLYFVYHGVDPCEKVVDHIDGNTRNMSKANLCLKDHSESCVNRKTFRNNKLGLRGIWKKGNSYVVQIQFKGKREMGWFDDLFDAICFRKSLEVKYGFTNMGKNQ